MRFILLALAFLGILFRRALLREHHVHDLVGVVRRVHGELFS